MSKSDDSAPRVHSAQSFAKAIENLFRQESDPAERCAALLKEERFVFGDKTPRAEDSDDDLQPCIEL